MPMISSESLTAARVLMVDDEQANLDLLERILRPLELRELKRTTHPRDVPGICREFQPDLLILDLMMPGMDGLELIEVLREDWGPDDYVPVLVLTSDHSHDTKRRGLTAGAQDYLTKPLSPPEVRLRVRNLLHTRFLHVALQNQNRSLESRVRERTVDLERARLEILDRLARAAEYRDDKTGAHTRRVGESAAAIAQALGLDDETVERIRRAAPLHDVGKIGIPDAILLHPGRLTPEQLAIMRTHTTLGGDLLAGSDFPLLRCAETIARTHHERWNGSGYPRGLSGTDIPIEGRVVAVADMFDALTHSRPYKRAWSVEEALAEIRSCSGRHFDHDVVDAFVGLVRLHGARAIA